MTSTDLWRDFLTHKGKIVRKWAHYFPVYERHFEPWRGRSMTFLEIGVAKGGSLEMWQRYFGPLAKVIGIDIDAKCARNASPGTFVRIGDQSDLKFLQALIDEFGIPDVVLDDGSHQMAHIRATFEALYPQMPKNSVYLVEDLHTAYWPEFGGGVDAPESFINVAKGLVDRLNADHSRGAVPADDFTRDTVSISFYDSIVVLEKGQAWSKTAPEMGAGAKPLKP